MRIYVGNLPFSTTEPGGWGGVGGDDDVDLLKGGEPSQPSPSCRTVMS